MNNERKQQLIDGLRQMADFLAAHDEVEVGHTGVSLDIFLRGDTQKERLIALARSLGKVEKRTTGDFFFLRRQFGKFAHLDINIEREQICRQVITEKVVPAQPEQTIVVPAKPERVEKVVSWECPESLLRPDAALDPGGREGEFVQPCQGEPLPIGAATS